MCHCSLDDDGHRNADSNHVFFLSLPFLSGSAASAAFCAASSVSSFLQRVGHTLVEHVSVEYNNLPLTNMCRLDSETHPFPKQSVVSNVAMSDTVRCIRRFVAILTFLLPMQLRLPPGH